MTIREDSIGCRIRCKQAMLPLSTQGPHCQPFPKCSRLQRLQGRGKWHKGGTCWGVGRKGEKKRQSGVWGWWLMVEGGGGGAGGRKN